jgi:hypothetical protein
MSSCELHLASHTVTFNQQEQEQSAEAAAYNLHCSQVSGSVSCSLQLALFTSELQLSVVFLKIC